MAFDVGQAIGYLDLDTSGFNRGFKSALQDLRTFQDESATVGDKFQAVGGAMTGVGKTLATNVTLPLVGIGAAAMTVGNKFESAMSRVGAISGATGDDLKALNDQALQLGADTAFSAQEAANGMENLASAGFNTNEIMSAMPGLLDLAASSGASVADASEIAASAIRGFGLEAGDAGHVADVFALAAAKTNAQTEDMGEAMKYVAPVAKAMGQSLEETAAAIGIMSDAGIKGSQAGTALRGAMSKLARPSEKAADTIERLGLEFYDTEGNMVPLNKMVTTLQDNLGGLTQEERNNALVTIFGQESLSGMLALMERGPDTLVDLTNSFKDADGAAASMAETMLDNTGGSIEQMMGSLETLGIKLQQVLAPVIKKIVDSITEFINKLSSTDEGTLKMITTIGLVVAAVGPVLMILGKLVSTVGSVMNAVKTLMPIITGAGAPFVAIAAIVGTLVAAFVHLWKTNEEFRDNITAIWNKIKTSFDNFTKGIVDKLNSLGFEFESITDVLGAIWDGFTKLLAPVFEGAFNKISIILETVFGVISGLFDVFAGIFTGDWDRVWNGLKETFGALWDGVVGIVQNAWNTVKGVLDVILGWFGTSWDEMWNTAVSVVTGVVDSIVNFFTVTIPEAFDSFIQGVINLADNIANFFTVVIPEKIQELIQWFTELPGKIAYAIGFAIGNIAKWVVDLAQKAAEVGPKVIDAIVNFFKELPGKIWTFLTETVTKFTTWISNTKEKAQTIGAEVIDKIVNFFKELPGKIWNALGEALNKVKEWGTNLINWAKEEIPKVIDNIMSFFLELPGKMLDVGKNLLQGLIDGVTGAVTGVIDGVKNVAGNILQGFKDAFGIHSPSRETAEMGGMLMKGLAGGMDNSSNAVLGAVTNLSDMLLSRMEMMVMQIASLMELATTKLQFFGVGSEEDKQNMAAYAAQLSALTESAQFHVSIVNMANQAYSMVTGLFGKMVEVSELVRSALDAQTQSYQSLTASIQQTISALRTLQAMQSSSAVSSAKASAGTLARSEALLEVAGGGGASGYSRAVAAQQGGSSAVSRAFDGAQFIFNSPKAVVPTEAARLLKKTAQQISMDFT